MVRLQSVINTGKVKHSLSDQGYPIVNHIAVRLVDKTPLPEDVKRFQPTLYYPSTLHLLGLATVAETRPGCF